MLKHLLRIKSYFFFLMMASFFICDARAAGIEKACLEKVESSRASSLTTLYRMEESFRNARWGLRKYQELVYGPLWQAVISRKDRFAGHARRAEAETLYLRYRLLADQERQQALEELEFSLQALDKLIQDFVDDAACGDAAAVRVSGLEITQFDNCMDIWNQETGIQIKKLKKILRNFRTKEEAFSNKVESSLSDHPSDHDTFYERFRDHFVDFDLKIESQFFQMTHTLKERYELTWPAEGCCALCQKDSHLRWDPVLSEIKPDPQGDLGVAGNMVNNARLKTAFEKFEAEEKTAKNEA